MKFHQLIKVTEKRNKRLGRGLGSGRGKTSGRGTKGQKARGKIPAGFIGGTLPLYKKLPFRRGLGNRLVSRKPQVVSLSKLEQFKNGETIDLEILVKMGLIKKDKAILGAKILGSGEIKNKLVVKLPVSKKARSLIEKAGGKAEWPY